MAAGVRISFHSDTTTLSGRIEQAAAESPPIDLLCDGRLHASVELAERDAFEFRDLPAGEKLLELWLPQYTELRLRSLEVGDGASVSPFEDRRPCGPRTAAQSLTATKPQAPAAPGPP